jgi:hypothetical protein
MSIVDIAVLYTGFVGACSRFYGAGEPVHVSLAREIRSSAEGIPLTFGPSIRELGPAAEVDSFIPLFEALNWATSLESRIEADWPDSPEAKGWYRLIPCGLTVRSVRFARNRVHHQWADAFTVDDAGRELPPRLVPWTWRPHLPAGKPDQEGERLYSEDLAGEPVIGALGRLSAIFGTALRRLHDDGIASSELLTELLPVIDSMNPEEFSRDSITSTD